MAKALRLEFTQNADQLGTHHFKQLKCNDDVYIYERRKLDGSLFGYEVFKAKCVAFPDGIGGLREAKDVYPSAKSFGRTAWFCQTLEQAEARFIWLCQR